MKFVESMETARHQLKVSNHTLHRYLENYGSFSDQKPCLMTLVSDLQTKQLMFASLFPILKCPHF